MFLDGGENIFIKAIDQNLSHDDIYSYKTIYIKALDTNITLPDVHLQIGDLQYLLPGKSMQAFRLNPPKDFCHILAKRMSITKYQAVQYNKDYNLVVMKLHTLLGNIEDMHISYALKQEIKEKDGSFPDESALYYAIIPSSITMMKLSYFDTDAREFKTLSLPINVKDEIVSTQSDINPNEDRHKTLKIALFLGFGLLLLLWSIVRRNLFLSLVSIAIISYAGYLFMPLEKVCIKRGAKIHILPTKNSTVFRIIPKARKYIVLKKLRGYIKIQLPDNKIGWVEYEDRCKN